MNQLGFHYYPDTQHYRQSDLAAWLPELQAMNAGWLALLSPSERAIPESFLRGFIEAGIEPLVQFAFAPDRHPSADDLQLLFKSYARWGVKYVALFDRPNLRRSWQAAAWAQSDLVERFLDIYLPLAERGLHAGLTPVFPPLEPGGDYWDTVFLRAALQGIQRRGHTQLLQKLVVGAVAWAGDQELDWGAGGPDRWPGARPYFTSQEDQDQRGFRIFDWYDALVRAVLVEPRPIFLFGMGCPTGDNPDFQEHTRKNLAMAQLLAGDSVPGMEPIRAQVIGGAFRLVADSSGGQPTPGAWFRPDGETLPIVAAVKKWAGNLPEAEKPSPGESRKLAHYLLLPSYEWGITDFHFDLIRPFVKKHQPTIGFSVEEALQAQRVTVVGGPQVFPEEKASQLRAAGCIVERIGEDGIDVASYPGNGSSNLFSQSEVPHARNSP